MNELRDEARIFKADYKIDLDMAYTAANSIIVGNPQIKRSNARIPVKRRVVQVEVIRHLDYPV